MELSKHPKKIIKVILLITNQKSFEVEIESVEAFHETEIYDVLEKMFPAYICVNYDVNSQQGYEVEYKNGLRSLAIYKSN